MYHTRQAKYPPYFFLSIRPPFDHTLFPYTTLFRSHAGEVRLAVGDIHGAPQSAGGERGRDAPEGVAAALTAGALWGTMYIDRKSTRLNSSHQIISYAVFCLKKKSLTCCHVSFFVTI